MNVRLSPDEERRLSDRYTDGKRYASDETQARVFKIYRSIGNALRTYGVTEGVTEFDSSVFVFDETE